MMELDDDDLQILHDLLDEDDNFEQKLVNSKPKSTLSSSKTSIHQSSQSNNQDSIWSSSSSDDDFDEILNPAKSQQKTPSIQSYSPKSNKIMFSPPTSPSTQIGFSSVPSANQITQKCNGIYLGGTDLTNGATLSSTDPHFCSSLICISCDHKVSRYLNKRWKPETDYLFLRNNYPNTVAQNLIPAEGWCAYCCQCTSCEEQRTRKLSPYTTHWVCRGHQLDDVF